MISHQHTSSRNKEREKMAEVADMCMLEITKLRAKIKSRYPFTLVCSKNKGDPNEAQEVNSQTSSCSSSSSSPSTIHSPAKARSPDTMSEMTVFLLMDRFAPS
ncbi:Unknown protein [Striga hermonthica]|uniref:Uncharacterized protein n=1 Tax=Striga hermonthica TaxID=68872 RepID=A0A9N7NHR3_STRHE|nr:Unknown protein [Striga hermonthica]